MPHRWLALVGIFMVSSCGFEPEGAEQRQPPAIYAQWFASTEACAGHRGDYARITWFVVPGTEFTCSTGRCVAHWRDDHSIFIAEQFFESEMVVRHEMLHDILGKPGHPDPPFAHGCGLTWTSWHGGAVPAGRRAELNIRHSLD